jgi:hypothetical protein
VPALQTLRRQDQMSRLRRAHDLRSSPQRTSTFRNDTTVQLAASYQMGVINRSQLERALAGAMLPWSDWGVPLLNGRVRTKVKRHHFTARFRQPKRMLSKNTARMGEQSKAVGCVSPTALLSAVAASGPGKSCLPTGHVRRTRCCDARQQDGTSSK